MKSRYINKIFLSIIFLLLYSNSNAQLPSQKEYDALWALYNATDGDNWTGRTGWESANPDVIQYVGDWRGITVDNEGHVTQIFLGSNGLSGVLPEEIGNLSYLKVLYLSINGLIGEIPQTLTNLQNLERLELTSNQLNGSIPQNIGDLSNLIYLLLNKNNLSGNIPASIVNLNKLSILDLSYNSLEGTIPSNIDGLTDLTNLTLSNNSLSGEIPPSIVNLNKLRSLDLRNDGLTGEIPLNIGNLTNLESLYLDNNNLIGSIPASVESLSALRIFNANYNNLSGEIPNSITNITTLSNIQLKHNPLTGAIPENIGDLTNLVWIDFSECQLNGQIPESITNLQKLIGLNLDDNLLYGYIPKEIGNIPNLNTLYLDKNLFTFSSLIDIYSNLLINHIPYFQYSPQNFIDEEKTINVNIGQALVLTTNIDRETDPPSKYQWYKRNGKYTMPVTDLCETCYEYQVESVSESDLGSYYYIIRNDLMIPLTLQSYDQEVVLGSCGTITPQFSYEFNLCFTDFTSEIDNPSECDILSYLWDFGDGTTSSEQNPRHVFADFGNYLVHLDVEYLCDDGCGTNTASYEQEIELISPAEMIENLIIEVHSKQLPGVLSASAATFSDVWNLDHLDESLNERHAFENGKLGVWRLEGNYVYEKNRNYAGDIDISTDGTYTLDYFNWPYARFNAVPNWKKVNMMTKYSPYGFETENKDILDRYSSAVYGYGGQLPTATGQNMMESEIAYAGFEDATGFENGNWKIGNEGIAEYTYIPVNLGIQQYAIVKQPRKVFDDVATVDVSYQSIDFLLWGNIKRTGYLRDVNILCAIEHEENPDWTWVILDRIVSPVNTLWFGTLNIPNVFEPVDMPVIDQTVAHTGSSSLKISEIKTYKQDLLHLEKGKNYMISGWVSVNNPNLLMPDLGEGIQIEVNFVREDDTKLLTENILIQPTGNIIEGWQKIEGSFTVPETDDEITLEVTFNPGTPGLIWLDDLRLHPESGNMNSYVYETTTYRLRAVLDENNYASLYFYDVEGNLHLTKKETVRGIKTIQETNMHLKNR